MGHTRARPILVVEDEPSISDAVRYNLEREGFSVLVAEDGRAGLKQFREARPVLVVLDLMLPQMPGLDLCRLMRAESSIPIIVLTAKDAETDKVVSLELGADDYVTKPFSMRELISRVRAQLRRSYMADYAPPEGPVLSAGPVVLNPQRHEVTVAGQAVALPPKEFAILELLIERKGMLVTRETLIDEVWGSEYFGDTKTLDVHIKRIRQKIEPDPKRPSFIQTIRGLGYKFAD